VSGRCAVLAALLTPLALLAPVDGAGASHGQRTIFDATSSLLGAGAKERSARLNELDSLGVDTVRVVLQWRSIAPRPGRSRPPAGFNASDPRDYGGAFGPLDATIRGAAARGMRVLLTPSGPIPDWASKSGRSRIADPEPARFRQFVAALGRRYGGGFRLAAGDSGCPAPPLPCVGRQSARPLPRVTFWAVWSEPNQDLFLRPQLRAGLPYSPRLYRRLFLAAQAGLAATGHRRDALLIGETAPSGGRDGVDPLEFLRGVLCLDRDYHRKRGCPPIRARGWSHHPYSFGIAPYQRSSNPNLINLATIGRLVRALRKAARAGATHGRLGLYVTEYGIQTRPGDLGVSPKRQAAYLAISEFLAWRDQRIRSYAQYLLRDDPPQYEFSFTTGLRFHGGRTKPSLRSFPLTLLARRNGSRVKLWGHVRPGEGPYRVEVRYRSRSGPSHRLRAVRTDRRGYFSFSAPYRSGRRWGAHCTLPGGRSLYGPYLHAFSF
jgi:hypothetical protein